MPKPTDITFRCPRCQTGYTYEDTGSTDVFFCRKHPKVRMNRKEAVIRDMRCMMVENSRCPSCGSSLIISKLPTNQFYLKCIDCDWNSNQKSPVIVSSTEKGVVKEAERYGLAQRGVLCDERSQG